MGKNKTRKPYTKGPKWYARYGIPDPRPVPGVSAHLVPLKSGKTTRPTKKHKKHNCKPYKSMYEAAQNRIHIQELALDSYRVQLEESLKRENEAANLQATKTDTLRRVVDVLLDELG